MNESDIYRELNQIFCRVFDDDRLTVGPTTAAADIAEWDSFNHINIVVAAEMKFGVKFTTTEIDTLKNVGDFVALIRSKTG
jgi:acyl carrier protein